MRPPDRTPTLTRNKGVEVVVSSLVSDGTVEEIVAGARLSTGLTSEVKKWNEVK